MPKLLVVDDEPNVLYSIEKGLQSDELEVVVAATGRQGIELLEPTRPDAVILDVRLSDMSGLDVFDRIRQVAPRLPVIIITAYTSTETAIEAMKRGAFEYLLKPLDLHQLRDVVQRALELSRFRHVPAVFADEPAGEDAERIIGHSAPMQEVYKAIGRFAPRDETVLITGESGTGKELVARALFHHSSRANQPFLALNCAAIPESLLESELFGHERGAFIREDDKAYEKLAKRRVKLAVGDDSAANDPKVLAWIGDYLALETADCEFLEGNLRYLRSAKIEDAHYFIWEYHESDGTKCYVTLCNGPAGSVLGMREAWKFTPEQYIYGDYHELL